MRAVNLIPTEQRSGTSVGLGRSQGGAYAVLVLVGGLAALALIYGMADHQIASRRSQAATIANRVQQTHAAAEKLAPYTSFLALREQRTQDVETLVDSRFDWAHALHELGRVLPPRTSISSLAGTVGSASATTSAPSHSSSATATSATPPGSVPTFTLAGCATSQPAVALTLERLRLMDGVSEVALESSTATLGGSGGGSGGGCPSHDPAFTVQITFDPLPSTSAAASATRSASNSTAPGADKSTSTGVNAR